MRKEDKEIFSPINSLDDLARRAEYVNGRVVSGIALTEIPSQLNTHLIAEVTQREVIESKKLRSRVGWRETGAWIHMQNSRLVEPEDLTVSTVERIERPDDPMGALILHSITPPYDLEHDNYPVAFTHSHPSGGFSSTDIYLIVGEDQVVNPVITTAGSEQFLHVAIASKDLKRVSFEASYNAFVQAEIDSQEKIHEYCQLIDDKFLDDFEIYTGVVLDAYDGSPYDFVRDLYITSLLGQQFGFAYAVSRKSKMPLSVLKTSEDVSQYLNEYLSEVEQYKEMYRI